VTVHFAGAELSRLDALAEVDALALSFFGDERPLRGVAGLTDWRLSGRVSRLLKAGRLTGMRGEVTIMPPPARRLPFARLFFFGLGESDYPAPFGEAEYRTAVRDMRQVLSRAGVARYAVQPPGRATGLIAPRRALELWLEVAAADGIEADVTVVESPSGQKEMSEALRKATSPGAGGRARTDAG
jgi:hypothetical protein